MLCRSARNVSAPTRPARSPRKRCVPVGVTPHPTALRMATQAFCRALQADADVVISQPGLRRGAGRCSNARWGGHAYGHDHRMRLCCVPGGRDRIAPSVERAGAVAPTTKQSRMRTRTSPRSCRGQSDAPREGPMVRILFPPALSQRRTVPGWSWSPIASSALHLHGRTRLVVGAGVGEWAAIAGSVTNGSDTAPVERWRAACDRQDAAATDVGMHGPDWRIEPQPQ